MTYQVSISISEHIEAGHVLLNERLKLSRIQKWLHDKVRESFLFRNWLSYKKNIAWRLLRLAMDENHGYRLRAIRSLVALDFLTGN